MARVLEYQCPCCGGAIQFDSGTQKMKCPYCDTEFDVSTLQEFEQEQLKKEDRPDWSEAGNQAEAAKDEMDDQNGEFVSYICEACGGEIIADRSMASSRCPYCDNPVIVMKQLSGNFAPDLIIPFKLNREQAMENLRGHLKGKTLLPRAFRTENKIQEVKGMYVPFWLFDCDAKADLQCRGTRVRHWSDSRFEYTETSHYMITRGGDVSFESVPVDGSEKMANDLMESIEPYDYKEAVPFQMAYLAGFLADKYDVSSETCYQRANERIGISTERMFMDTIHGYATVVPEKKDLSMHKGKIRYALLPVWLLHTTYRGELYTFAMNGQTGKFVGNLPVDAGRAAVISTAVFAGVGAAALALTYLFV